jgi:hypothetical protein
MSTVLRVTDEEVAAHADDLAVIIPLLGSVETQHLWDAMKSRWTRSQLQTAVAQYRTDGSVAAFQELLIAEHGQRAKSYWKSKENVVRELREVIAQLGGWPSSRDLRQRRLSSLSYAMGKHGGVRLLREELGFPPEDVEPGHWQDVEHVLVPLREWMEKHGSFPTYTQLNQAGHKSLAKAIVAHGGYAAVRRRLGVDGGRKGLGHWSHAETRDAVLRQAIAENGGKFPSADDLRRLGHGDLMNAISRNGGLAAASERLGFGCIARTPKRPNGYWQEFEHVRKVILVVMEDIGRFPTPKELRKRGHHGMVCAIYEVHGGVGKVRERMGIEPDPPKKFAKVNRGHSTRARPGQWMKWENVEAALRPFVERLGRIPTQSELQEAGLSGLVGGITANFGGMRGAARRMGFEPNRTEDGFWKDWMNLLPELEKIAQRFGGIPAQSILASHGLSWISPWITHHGGFDQVRVRLGYIPVTDEHLRCHADALTQIVPQFGIPPSVLWSTMKARWTMRDLDAAMAEYNADGTLTSFRTLVDLG